MSEETPVPSSENSSSLYMRIARMIDSIHSPAREKGESVSHFLRRVIINKRVSKANFATNSVLTDIAMEYSELFKDMVHSMAPDSVGDKIFTFVNNMVVMDKLLDRVPRVLGISADEQLKRDMRKLWKSAEVPIKIDFANTVIDDRRSRQLEFFLDYVGRKNVGDALDLKLLKYEVANGRNEKVTVSSKFTILYMNGRVTDVNSNGCQTTTVVCKRYDRPFIVVMRQEDTGYYIVIISDMCKAVDNSYLFCSSSEWYNETLFVLRSGKDKFHYRYTDVPFSMFDPNTMSLQASWGNDFRIDTTFFSVAKDRAPKWIDPSAQKLYNRIYTGLESGISRSYALVGVPGTGKTALTDYIVANLPDDTLVITLDSERALHTFDNCGGIHIFDIKCKHVLVLLDDADRMYNEKMQLTMINMFTMLHNLCPGLLGPGATASDKNFALVATINDPTVFPDAVIKRSGRFDEVINIKLPSTKMYAVVMAGMKRENDLTDYGSLKYKLCFMYAKLRKITLADIRNVYEIMLVHTAKCIDCKFKFSAKHFMHAVDVIVKNKKNAGKNYQI